MVSVPEDYFLNRSLLEVPYSSKVKELGDLMSRLLGDLHTAHRPI